jgi:hypothetical protein
MQIFGMFGQMMLLPFNMMTGCMNALATGLMGMQQQSMSYQGCCGGGNAGNAGNTPAQPMQNTFGNAPGRGFPEDHSDRRYQGQRKEERHMSSCNCCDHDETVKLVEYTIVSIKPCDERIIRRGQVIYADDMDDDGFAAWVIARYLQGDDRDEDDGYDRRREHRGDDEEGDRDWRERSRRLPRDEKRYLRVYHRVLESWRRPDDCCDNRQIDVLRDIERAIRGMGRSSEARA